MHFGGPDQAPGQLRNVLLEKVRASPPGSRILWATYYFLDRELALALMEASDRGVSVTLVVEGLPRYKGANDPVLSLLKEHGLRGGLHIRTANLLRSGKLHAKIYIFSHPVPVALVGSFNPSGGRTADREVIADIGDQDRGHNLLVEIRSSRLVEALSSHVTEMAGTRGLWTSRFSASQNRIFRDRDTRLYFFPRLRTDVVESDIRRLGRGARVWGAVSHLDETFVSSLEEAAGRGATLNLIVHQTERRVAQSAVERLRKAGVSIRRYEHPDGLPMHAKFLLFEDGDERIVYLGSFNLNRASRKHNEELLVRSTEPTLFASIRRRFRDIEQEVERQRARQ